MKPIASTWASLGPAIDWLLQAVPLLAGGVSILSWVVWGLGSLLLLLLGGLGLLRQRRA